MQASDRIRLYSARYLKVRELHRACEQVEDCTRTGESPSALDHCYSRGVELFHIRECQRSIGSTLHYTPPRNLPQLSKRALSEEGCRAFYVGIDVERESDQRTDSSPCHGCAEVRSRGNLCLVDQSSLVLSLAIVSPAQRWLPPRVIFRFTTA